MDVAHLPYDQVDAFLATATGNWATARWRGRPLWQNLLDLNVISEHILATRPEVIVETGTFFGGSAVFFADMMRLAGVEPDVISVDVAPHQTPDHPGVRYLTGRSSTDPETVREVAGHVAGRRVFVNLDSAHDAGHVYEELRCYSGMVHVGDYLLAQDGNMYRTFQMPVEDTPIGGIARFLAEAPHFAADPGKSHFPTTSHVYGWLRRVA